VAAVKVAAAAAAAVARGKSEVDMAWGSRSNHHP
jgi:hypothetical protein